MAKLTRAEAINAVNAIISHNEILKIYDIEFKEYKTLGKTESLSENLKEIYIKLVNEFMEIDV